MAGKMQVDDSVNERRLRPIYGKLYSSLATMEQPLHVVDLITETNNIKLSNNSMITPLYLRSTHMWRPPRLSELTPYQISLGLTHLGLEASM